ncbi:MAG TPA: tripartite tricarboxylate transporter substrate binding protein [Burkholderiales bacterium]|nr:tripartite tricarboxylate transporter substrate binding protein [Burkholderiales bacterium]
MPELNVNAARILLLLTAVATSATAQTYPAKPVRVIVAFAPGGTTDILGRIYSQRLSAATGQQFVVDNRAGAGGTIGTEAVVRAAPDGYTINFGSTSSLAVSPNLYPKLPYELMRDVAPVIQVATAAFMLAVHPSVPARTMRELIALARARPGQLNYASSGSGSSLHLCGEYLKYLAKIDLVHVPYKGAGAALPDLIAGQVQILFSDMAPFVPYVQTGRLRVLAASTATRSRVYPEYPTIAESGVPGYDLAGWYGVVVPAATPRPIVDRLHAEFGKAMRASDMGERYATLGVEAVESTPEQFAAYMRAELAKWGDIIKRSGTKLE